MLVEVQIECPHCGAPFATVADTSSGDYVTIEDCFVCCRPMELAIACEPGEVADVAVRAL
jgi:hypothetical protein